MTTSIDEFREALLGAEVRVEFGPTINFTQGTTVDTARVFTKRPNGRWAKVDPLLLPREGEGRAELLDDLATIVRGRPAEPGPGDVRPGSAEALDGYPG